MSTQTLISFPPSPARDGKSRRPSILLARLLAAMLLFLTVAAQAAAGQALSTKDAAGYDFIAQHVRPGMTYVLDLADERQYNYVKHQLRLAGESPENSPELYRRIEAAHQEKRFRQPRLPVLDQAFATANSGKVVPLNIIETFLPPDPSKPRDYKLVTLSSYPDGTDYTHIAANLTYQKSGGGTAIFVKSSGSSKQAADGTNFRLTTEGTLPSDAASQDVTAHSLFVISKGNDTHTAVHVRVLGAHATDGCLSQPMYPGQTGCLNKLDQTNPLVMCYWRQPGQGQDCAYKSPVNHPPSYQFPIAGTATFDGPLDSVDSVILTLQRVKGGGGCVLCGMSSSDQDQCPGGGGSISASDITISGSQISWNWTGDKIAGFPNSGDCIQSGGDLTWMNLLITVIEGGGPNTGDYAAVQFSSQITDLEDGRYPLPEIDILDGCLARGTRIRLVDGSERDVEGFSGGGTESVRSGQRPVGLGRRVLGNTRGVEPIPMVRIEDGDGRSLLLTQQHPVVTHDGVRAARDLEVGDIVLTETGPRELILVGRQRYDDEVFNLKLDGNEGEVAAGETTMYANGFLVGDARLQRYLSRQALERRSRRSDAEILRELPAAWHQDFLNHQKSLPD